MKKSESIRRTNTCTDSQCRMAGVYRDVDEDANAVVVSSDEELYDSDLCEDEINIEDNEPEPSMASEQTALTEQAVSIIHRAWNRLVC
jgi:hypothetical protein